jgi:VWFA-related protein
MLTHQRRLISVAILMAILFSLAATTPAKDKEFKAVVRHFEKQYRAKRTKIPFLGLAGFAVKLIRPAGVKGFKLAIFENQDFLSQPEPVPFSAVMRDAYAKGWQPLLRIHSRRNGGARTFVYAREEGKDIKLAVVAFQEREAVVAEIKFNPDAAARFLQKPELLGVSLGGLTNNSVSVQTASSGGSSPTRRDSDYSADLSVLGRSADQTTAQPVSAENNSATTPTENAEPPLVTTEVTAKPAIKEETVRVETRLVNLNVKAITTAGQPFENLKPEDFTVYEDGVRQQLEHFAPVTAPISLVLLLDLSGSTEKKIKEMKEAAQKFVDALSANTSIAIGTFTSRFKLVTPFITDRAQLRAAIEATKHRGGGTEYYRAMGTALDLLKDTNDRRRVIVVLTDGVDNNLQRGPDPSAPEFDELLARISEEEVTIYPICFDTENRLERLGWMFNSSSAKKRRYAVARKQLESVAEQTGGVMFTASRAEDLHDAYSRVAAELQQLYSLAYLPDKLKHNGEFRKITVKVSRENAIARTRRGYYDK